LFFNTCSEEMKLVLAYYVLAIKIIYTDAGNRDRNLAAHLRTAVADAATGNIQDDHRDYTGKIPFLLLRDYTAILTILMYE
jgi:hypothetical protein